MPWGRDFDLFFAAHRLTPWMDKVKVCRCTGREFLEGFGEGRNEIDPAIERFMAEFVYIDGPHDYESVKADLELWWPRVSHNGILAGHDFDKHHGGVPRAVTEFARSEDLPVFLTQDMPSPSWYIYRNPPTAEWTRL